MKELCSPRAHRCVLCRDISGSRFLFLIFYIEGTTFTGLGWVNSHVDMERIQYTCQPSRVRQTGNMIRWANAICKVTLTESC